MPIPRHRHARTHDLRERMETTCGDRKALITFDDVIFRSVKREFASADEMVSGTGSAMCGGRFNPKGVPAVYGSLAPETAFGEAIDWYRRQGLPAQEAMPRVDVAMDVLLQKSLDLRHPETIERLGLTVVDLMEEWESAQQSNQEALSQCVGRIAAEMGIQGLLYPSARVEDATNLVIFPPCLDEECMLAPQGINGVD